MKTALLITIVAGGLLVSPVRAQGCARGGGIQSPGMGSVMSPLNTSPATAALQQAQMAYQYQAQLAYLQQQTQLQQAYLQQENAVAVKKQENRERKAAERRERKESEKARRLAAKANDAHEKNAGQQKAATLQERAASKFASAR